MKLIVVNNCIDCRGWAGGLSPCMWDPERRHPLEDDTRKTGNGPPRWCPLRREPITILLPSKARVLPTLLSEGSALFSAGGSKQLSVREAQRLHDEAASLVVSQLRLFGKLYFNATWISSIRKKKLVASFKARLERFLKEHKAAPL